MPWPSSAVNSGPRRLLQARGITETRRNSQPTCSTAFCLSPVGRPDLQSQAEYFDIFSPPPGEREVISQVDLLSSKETKIAHKSVRTAMAASDWAARTGIVSSWGGDRQSASLSRKALVAIHSPIGSLILQPRFWR